MIQLLTFEEIFLSFGNKASRNVTRVTNRVRRMNLIRTSSYFALKINTQPLNLTSSKPQILCQNGRLPDKAEALSASRLPGDQCAMLLGDERARLFVCCYLAKLLALK